MQTILNNKLRIGNFTSSEIHKLMSNGKAAGSLGKPALTYIQEKNYERKLGLSLGTESNAKPLTWGKFNEVRVFNMLGEEYELVSQETKQHPTIKCWAGSADCIKHGKVRILPDIKCCYTRKSFCELLECTDAESLKDYAPEYYWQLVSNAILNDCDAGELIVYMPYKSELNEIREATGGIDTLQKNLAWINFAEDEELPHLLDGGYYKNLNVISIQISNEDKEFLTNRVIAASEMLLP